MKDLSGALAPSLKPSSKSLDRQSQPKVPLRPLIHWDWRHAASWQHREGAQVSQLWQAPRTALWPSLERPSVPISVSMLSIYPWNRMRRSLGEEMWRQAWVFKSRKEKSSAQMAFFSKRLTINFFSLVDFLSWKEPINGKKKVQVGSSTVIFSFNGKSGTIHIWKMWKEGQKISFCHFYPNVRSNYVKTQK